MSRARSKRRGRQAALAGDPITREIIKGALRAAQAEMEAVIERTAMSPFIREKKDYFAGILDARGRVVCGTMVPLFGNLAEIIFRALERDLAQRVPSARALAEELERILPSLGEAVGTQEVGQLVTELFSGTEVPEEKDPQLPVVSAQAAPPAIVGRRARWRWALAALVLLTLSALGGLWAAR